jgi:SAM-dependent methyltransferase
MNLRKAIMNKIGGKNTGAERFYFKYGSGNALTSEWVAHYFIYTRFLQNARQVPTLDLCCGSGAGTKLIAEMLKVRVAGADYSDEALAFAQTENGGEGITYYKLDLNKQLDTLQDLIRSKGIKQVFFIEGIEHIKRPVDVVNVLLTSGVQEIFISTPNEKEGTTSEGHHISPFTPSTYADFEKRFGSKVLCYCKFVDKNQMPGLLAEGLTEDEIMQRHFTNSREDSALNYLMQISR